MVTSSNNEGTDGKEQALNPYGLPHIELRPHQGETIEQILDTTGSLTIEAATGSGKTALARAVSSRKSVIALCQTKNLQEANYGQLYGFTVLKGRANYRCIHPNARTGMTGEDCFYLEKSMRECPRHDSCPYLVWKARAKASPRVSLNYAYWLRAKWPKDSPPRVLFLDEAHNLPDIVLSWVGCLIYPRDRLDWELSQFPFISKLDKGQDATDKAMAWLKESIQSLAQIHSTLKESSIRLRNCKRMEQKLSNVSEALEQSHEDWYIRSSPVGFTAKPLTARYHFSTLFLVSETTVEMSATIGDFKTYAQELGIGVCQTLRIPSQWLPETRLVHALDVPHMGQSAKESDFEYQADAIAQAVKSCPSDWSGFIHVTRVREAPLLAQRLARRGLQNRIWVPPVAIGTDLRIEKWEQFKRRNPGALAISWDLWEGIDALDEKICIAAKVPYFDISSEYETERLHYDGKMYKQRAAWKLEQGLGRTRRGRPEDYDLDGEVRGFVAIADGSWRGVQKYLSESLREAIC